MSRAGPPHRRARRASHDLRIVALALAGGLPAVIVVFLLLVLGDHSARVVWTVGGLVVIAWVVAAVALRARVVRPLQTLANLLDDIEFPAGSKALTPTPPLT